MIVMKFGGTSLGSPDRVEAVCEIVARVHRERGVRAVVCSAFSQITNTLVEMGDRASRRDDSYRELLADLETRHRNAVAALLQASERDALQKHIDRLMVDLNDVLHGVYLIRELSPRTRDFILGFGERLSALIVSRALARRVPDACFLDTRTVIRTDDRFGMARVDQKATYSLLRAHFGRNPALQVATGFIAATESGQATTLGRGGSDYTASLIGAAIQSQEIQIWTDVDGVLTADPRKIKDVFVQPEISYEEAMEMAHFGAKVIFPPTMSPAISANIPLIIKNTFNPDARGTRIGQVNPDRAQPVRGVSSIERIALLQLKGSGLIGVEGISSRLFGTLAREKINVILISQASSEYSICVAISPSDADKAKRVLDKTFRREIGLGQINELTVETELSVIAVVGEGMRRQPGISGKIFSALGRAAINVKAVAQGSSERNVSLVVSADDEKHALAAIHHSFFHNQNLCHVFLIGTGLIGSELMTLIDQLGKRKENTGRIRVVGLANSRKMVIDREGVEPTRFQEVLDRSDQASDLSAFVAAIGKLKLSNSILVDCTASSIAAELYESALRTGVSVATPNKKANSGSQAQYEALFKAARLGGSHYLYEANVGAGLPVISSLRTLIRSGDRILKIEAMLSGTLAFLFNTFSPETPFSEAVKTARRLGFTEPDPRDDLNGTDVARKLLILARESGFQMELDQVQVESLIPAECEGAESVDDFLAALPLADAYFAEKLDKAIQAGRVLRYLARFEDGRATVCLAEVGPEHPCYHVSGNDNLISLTTERYRTNPMVIQGPGAGAAVTAAQVLAEIVEISRSN